MTEMSVEGFLDHRTGGGGGEFLDRWKDEKEARSIDVVLSRRAPIVSVWRHRIPRIEAVKEDGVEKLAIRDANWVCWETEDLLRNQKRRSKEPPYSRLIPPKACGACRFIEHLHDRVAEGDLDWLAPVLRFDARDGNPARVVHAAGVYGGFGRDDLSSKDLEQMNRAGVYRKFAWKEDQRAKCSYIFRVVPYAHPEQGLQIATENSLLGDKVRTLIKDAMMSLGKEEGNPARTPYVIRWQNFPLEKEFGKKYHATRIDQRQAPITEAVLAAIDAVPPDVALITQRLESATLRHVLERACLIDGVPWDDLFGPVRPRAAPPAEAAPQPPAIPAQAPLPVTAVGSPVPATYNPQGMYEDDLPF